LAVQGAGRSDVGGALLLYAADDLGAWEERGYLLTAEDAVAAQLPECAGWECPQVVRVGDDWVILLSLWSPNEPHRGVGYILGALDIDAETSLPVFTAQRTGFVDDGSTFYAPQAVQAGGADGGPERVLLWGWAQEGTDAGTGRTQDENDAAGWSGLLTFPREVVVRDGAVELVPARELERLRGESVEVGSLPDQAEVALSGSGPVELVLDGGTGRVLWTAELEDDEVRILIDASIVEIHRVGHPSRTLRAHPGDGEHYAVRHGDTVDASAWGLRLPSPSV
jgi:beta-fructofuranosidase